MATPHVNSELSQISVKSPRNDETRVGEVILSQVCPGVDLESDRLSHARL